MRHWGLQCTCTGSRGDGGEEENLSSEFHIIEEFNVNYIGMWILMVWRI